MILDFLRSNPDLLITALGLIGGWLGITKSRQSSADLARTIAGALKGEAARQLEQSGTREAMVRALTRAAFDALHRVGIKAGKTRDRLVALAVEEAVGELEERIIARRLKEAAAGADRVVAAFKPGSGR